MTEDDALSRVRAACAAFGFDLDAASEVLVERMRLLEERSPTFDDARRMATYAERIFRHYEAADPASAFTPMERRTSCSPASSRTSARPAPRTPAPRRAAT